MGSGAVELTTRKAGGIVRVWKGWCGARGCSNPSVLTAKRFGDKKGVDMQLKRNKATVCALPSIPPPFDKGGKCDSAFRAIVRFCEGLVRNERLLTEVSEKRKGYGKCDNPSGSRPNFFGDSTSPLTRGGKNVVRSEGEASNPSGSRPNFFGRQHLTFDKGGKCDGDF